jgi:hypothetical protein
MELTVRRSINIYAIRKQFHETAAHRAPSPGTIHRSDLLRSSGIDTGALSLTWSNICIKGQNFTRNDYSPFAEPRKSS